MKAKSKKNKKFIIAGAMIMVVAVPILGAIVAKSNNNNNASTTTEATVYLDASGQKQTTFETDLSNVDSTDIIQIGYFKSPTTGLIQVPKMPDKVKNVPNTLPKAVTSLKSMFANCVDFSQDISNWDVSSVNDMSLMFSGAKNFNVDLSKWNINPELNFHHFSQSAGFANDKNKHPNFIREKPTIFINEDGEEIVAESHDLSEEENVQSIKQIGFHALEEQPEVIQVDRMPTEFSEITNILPKQISLLNSMFVDSAIEEDVTGITSWDTSFVTDMTEMFSDSDWNVNISQWNTSNVIIMNFMFYSATNFNQNIGNWNTKNVTEMKNMFEGATNFNQNLSKWNVEKVKAYEKFALGSGIENNKEKWPPFK